MHKQMSRGGWLAALGLALAWAVPSYAQTDVTTTRVSGVVKEQSGSALPGATVEAKNQETGFVATAVTDAAGFYRLINLPTGMYTISAALDGFTTADQPDVRLSLNSTPTVNFNLQSSTVTETITVSAEVPVVEVTNTAASTLINVEMVKNLPVAQRDFRNLVVTTPETRFDSERGNISISGQRGINTNVTVDGVDYNDAFFGGTAGFAEGRAPLSISQESVKEISVITNGASVEFGRSSGGFVNVITKSGTNQLRGSAFFYDQPQSLISDFANGVKPADQKKKSYGGSLGGAILADKLFYFASYDKQDKSITVPIDRVVLDAAVFAKYPGLASPDTYAQTQNGDVLFGRMDFQATPAHRFMLRGNFTKYDGENGTSSATTRTASYNGVEGLDNDTWVASYSGQFGPNLLNDLNLNHVKEDVPRADKGLGLPDIQVNGLGAYGEVSFLPIVSTTKRKAIGDTVSYLLGAHVLKGGFEYNDTSITQVFKGNWRGVYRFNNKADFLAGKWASYNQFGGLGGRTADQAGTAAFGQKETALFLQDQWYLSPSLTLTYGVRFESLDNPNNAVLNQNDRNPDGSFKLNAKVPDAGLADQISPRIGLSWAPDGKTAVRTSIGRYWARTPGILLAQLFTSNGQVGTQYIVNAPQTGGVVTGPPTDPLSPGWGANFDPTRAQVIDFTRVPNPRGPGVFAIDPNYENAYTDRFSLGAEREIMEATAVGVDFTYAKSKQLQRLTDINLQYDGTTSTNGLPHYSRTRPDSFYGRITTSVSDATSKYTALTVDIRRRLFHGVQYYGAITWSKDKDSDSNERNFAGIQAEDVNNIGLNYGFSNRDQKWRGVGSVLWETPWWGISMASGFRYASGSTINVTAGSDINGDNNNVDRPTINGDHVARNSERQPDVWSVDFRVAKAFKIGPVDTSVFAECFNCTNRSNWSIPTNNWVYGNANLDHPTNANFLRETTPGTPRTIQLGLRVDF